MEMNTHLKAVPYGKGSFAAVRRESFAYCDKTKFIELLEQSHIDYPFIVRPRRFGKTLFTNTLFDYYDSAKASSFDASFKGTYIYDHKTASASSYCVLYCSFAGIASGDVLHNFFYNLELCLKDFLDRYPVLNKDDFLSKSYLSPAELFKQFISSVKTLIPHKLYVIIDEYDQFTNELLSRDVERFKEVSRSEGFIKDFYAALKEACDAGVVERTFITGVTSVSLDSMTSGFNIADKINTEPLFATLFGFTDDELKELIPQVLDLKRYGHSVDEVFERMKELYDGYRFSLDSEETVFNASMSLYYLRKLSTLNHEPSNLLDPAFAQDLSKIHGILSLGNIDFVKDVVTRALHFETIHARKLPEAINLNSKNLLDDRDVIALMFYLGYLTYADKSNTFKVPNKTVCTQFFEYYLKYLCGLETFDHEDSDFEEAFVKLAKGEPRCLLETVSARFIKSSGIHASAHLDESNLQTALQAVLFFSDDYEVKAEEEALGQGYTDLILQAKDPTRPSYIFELKYLKKSACSEELVAKAKSDALTQLERYKSANNVSDIPNLKQVVAVFGGFELKDCEVF